MVPGTQKLELKRLMYFAGHVGQETIYDRKLVIRAILARGNRGVRMLVFGCGKDSGFWARTMNPNGTTIFLEDKASWANFDRSLQTHVVKYHTAPMGVWQEAMQNAEGFHVPRSLFPKLNIEGVPPGLFESRWDVILIDAPLGAFAGSPGRMAPPSSRLPTSLNVSGGSGRAHQSMCLCTTSTAGWNASGPSCSSLFLTPHARMINYEGLSHSNQIMTTNSSHTYMAWFHTP